MEDLEREGEGEGEGEREGGGGGVRAVNQRVFYGHLRILLQTGNSVLRILV